jgi:hypothetical protein
LGKFEGALTEGIDVQAHEKSSKRLAHGSLTFGGHLSRHYGEQVARNLDSTIQGLYERESVEAGRYYVESEDWKLCVFEFEAVGENEAQNSVGGGNVTNSVEGRLPASAGTTQ